jgi:hypothetical protein
LFFQFLPDPHIPARHHSIAVRGNRPKLNDREANHDQREYSQKAGATLNLHHVPSLLVAFDFSY